MFKRLESLLFAALCLSLLFFAACDPQSTASNNADQEEMAAGETPPEKEALIENPLLIKSGSFFQLRPGTTIPAAPHIQKGLLQTGDGDFDIFHILSESGDTLGYILPDPNDEKLIGDIVVTTQKAVTEQGIHVGMTYQQLKDALGTVEVHGSELEGQTSATKGGLYYYLDEYFFSYEIDESQIKPDTKITEIMVGR